MLGLSIALVLCLGAGVQALLTESVQILRRFEPIQVRQSAGFLQEKVSPSSTVWELNLRKVMKKKQVSRL